MERGNVAYTIVSNYCIEQVKIVRMDANFATMKLGTGGAIRLAKSRIYGSEEEAAQKLKKDRPRRGPHENR